MRERYDLRKESAGWAVFDIWTGHAVVIAGQAQDSLERDDALELVELLNDQGRRGDRVVLQ